MPQIVLLTLYKLRFGKPLSLLFLSLLQIVNMHYFQLIRVKNLAIIVLTLVLMRYAVIHPIYRVNGAQPIMSNFFFWLFVLHTVLIAAAGNIINDYFDTHIDEINKPEKVIVGKKVPRKTAMTLHQVLTGIGAVIALYLAYIVSSIPLAFLLLFIPGLLWFYSSVYKRQFLIGNVIIALLCALVPLTLVMIENRFMFLVDGERFLAAGISKAAWVIVAVFAGFAFMVTLIREIIKDVQDEEGDRELECNTLPIVWGRKWTKVVVSLLLVSTIVALAFVYQVMLSGYDDKLSFYYILLFLIIPLVVGIVFTVTAKEEVDYARISTLLKYIMTSGIVYGLVFYLLMARTYDIPFFGLMVQ